MNILCRNQSFIISLLTYITYLLIIMTNIYMCLVYTCLCWNRLVPCIKIISHNLHITMWYTNTSKTALRKYKFVYTKIHSFKIFTCFRFKFRQEQSNQSVCIYVYMHYTYLLVPTESQVQLLANLYEPQQKKKT